MITVTVLINGQTIFTRSAINTRRKELTGKKRTFYETDLGTEILHDPEDGAIALAHKLLNTIHEPKRRVL